MEYLGFWVNQSGIQPIYKKLEAIINMTPPKNMEEVRAFIGIVNYYRDMWYRRSHLLNPLTALTLSKVKFKWSDVDHKSFYDIKRAVTHNNLLAYPGFNKRFIYIQMPGIAS